MWGVSGAPSRFAAADTQNSHDKPLARIGFYRVGLTGFLFDEQTPFVLKSAQWSVGY